MKELNFGEAALLHAFGHPAGANGSLSVVPFFSIRKLRLVFNELARSENFEYGDFDAFKHHVLSCATPQLELSKWQAIAARR